MSIRIRSKGGRFFDGKIGEVMIYDEAFTADGFAAVLDFLSQKWLGDPVGGVLGDFNEDGVWNTTDIDLLGNEIIAGMDPDHLIDLAFDMNKDGLVDLADQDRWREEGATVNGFASAYLNGDTNLDGIVDAGDLNEVGLSWQQMVAPPWSQGDFNASGFVDAGDLNLLGLNWQESILPAAASAAVPEPNSLAILCLGVITLVLGRRIGVR